MYKMWEDFIMRLQTGYLAHPFDSRKTVRIWEQKFERDTGIDLVNPFYDIERTDVEEIDQNRAERYEKLDHIHLVERDLTAIYASDFIVAFITGDLSYGTIQEIVYAALAEKPVYLIVSNGHADHPWLKYHADKIFTNTADFKWYIMKVNEEADAAV